MELESDDGATIPIESGSAVELGRGQGFYDSDRTVSRRHVSIDLRGPDKHNNGPGDEASVSFEVIGKNPIWVLSRSGGGKRVYRRSEVGELRAGDGFSLSINKPFFFKIRRKDGREAAVEKGVLDAVRRREKRTAERRKGKEKEKDEAFVREMDEEAVVAGLESELELLDVSRIDPVEEFGFLVKGHEFDHYPRQRVRPIKNWKWFLEEPAQNSNKDEPDDEETMKGKKGWRRRKNKGVGSDDDEEWTGESEDEKVTTARAGSVKRPEYATRSRDPKKPCKVSSSYRKRASNNDSDEEDETLGGFIVNNEEEGEGEEEGDEEEEEEEEEEDEDYVDDD